MAQRHNVAIIGLGVIGRRMLAKMPLQGRLDIVGGWDPSEAARAETAALFPWLTIAPNAETLIASPDVDLVYVGAPPRAHAAISRAAFAAGKAVFCEKPLGIDLADSRALTEEAEASARPTAVNLSLAGSRAVAAMRAALADGSIGAVAGADIRLHFAQWPRAWQAGATWLAHRAEGGFVREVGSHFLYLVDELLGPGALIDGSCQFPETSAQAGAQAGAETHAMARFDHGGVPVTFAGSVGGAGPDLVEFTLWGAARSYRLSAFYQLTVSDGGDWANAMPEIPDPAGDAYALQLDHLAAMMDGGAHVLPDFRAALRVQELVEGLLAR
jgi:predicted dehydrogenase